MSIKNKEYIFVQWDDKDCNEAMDDTDVFPPRNVKQENDGKIYGVMIYL